jgi:hypothetical protein
MQLCDGSKTFHIFNEHLFLNSVWGHLYTLPVAVGFLYRSLSSKEVNRSNRPTEIFQPLQQGFVSVHAQLQLLGKIVRLLGNYIVNYIRYKYKTDLRVWVVRLHRNKKD